MVEAKGSGYGAKGGFVPVLKQNNYEINDGEGSVFTSELSKADALKLKEPKKKKKVWEHQDYCQ